MIRLNEWRGLSSSGRRVAEIRRSLGLSLQRRDGIHPLSSASRSWCLVPQRRDPCIKGSHLVRPELHSIRRVRATSARPSDSRKHLLARISTDLSLSVSRAPASSDFFAQARSFLLLLFEVSPFGAVHETVNIVEYSAAAGSRAPRGIGLNLMSVRGSRVSSSLSYPGLVSSSKRWKLLKIASRIGCFFFFFYRNSRKINREPPRINWDWKIRALFNFN